jgi:AcrR family transcriptional regulator
MPRISEEARAARRAQILDAARETFAARGFRQTSMDDILRAAGVSAGGAYRYFASKDEIMAAIAADALAPITDAIEQISAMPPELTPDQATRRLALLLDEVAEGPGRLALMVWGEAQSDPAIAALAQAEAGRIRTAVTGMVVRTRRPESLMAESPEMLGAVLFSLVVGYLMQRRVIGDISAEAYVATVQHLLVDAASAA